VFFVRTIFRDECNEYGSPTHAATRRDAIVIEQQKTEEVGVTLWKYAG
jgi:hypothetical protein